MLVALTFTACGEEVNIDGPNTVPIEAKTVFASADDGTRTSIDRKANFYWEEGDKIWVDNGTGYVSSGQSDITTAKQAQAKFVVDGNFISEPVKVLYTGYGDGDTTATYYNKVTIADQQTQKAWNDGSHLGTSGDCATGLAYKKPGGYKFTLDHKASYLMLYPYMGVSGSYTLQKIEIFSDLSASSIAGDFDFTFDNGLADHPRVGTGKQAMTLTCDGGFQLSQDVPTDITSSTTYRHCFVVIAPGTHQLTIKYTAKSASGTDFVFYKDIDSRKYEANGVYPFIHELKDAAVNYGFRYREASHNNPSNYYSWGMTTPYNGTDVVVNTTTTQVTDGFWADIPSFAAMTWYVKENKYWDSSTEWIYVMKDGTEQICHGGVWIKKWNYIPGASKTTRNATTSNPPLKGRPDASVIGQYFFIPALYAQQPQAVPRPSGPIRLWSSSPQSSSVAWATEITPNSMTCGALYMKTNNWLCYPLNEDGSPWWQ